MKMGKSDVTAKILTLVIAIFLWSYVMSETNPDTTQEYRNIAVSYTNTAALERQGLVIMEPEEVRINVRVTGKRSDMSRFSSSSIYAQVDLSGYSEGQVKIPITVGLLDQASGIRIINHEPKEALFTFDRLITREIPVEIVYQESLPEGYVYESVTARPQSILISGPRTWINEVAKAEAVVGLSGRTENFSVTAPVKIVNDEGEEVRGIEKDPGFIDVSMSIFRTTQVPVVLQTINELPENYAITDIELSPSNVMVKGDNSVTEIAEIKTMPVDLSLILENQSMVVDLELPEGVTLLDPNQIVRLTYNVEEIVSRTFEFGFEDIDLRNLENGFDLEPVDPNQLFEIQIRGYSSLIDDISIEDLKIYLNLQGYEPGEHQVQIRWEDIEDIIIVGVDPPSVEIVLTE